jgi:hypothetical protein
MQGTNHLLSEEMEALAWAEVYASDGEEWKCGAPRRKKVMNTGFDGAGRWTGKCDPWRGDGLHTSSGDAKWNTIAELSKINFEILKHRSLEGGGGGKVWRVYFFTCF